MNCRSVSPKTWEHARQALIFYFSRRHGIQNAEDLAHETLAAVLGRSDYEFNHEEEFLKVCYGFAAHMLQNALRETKRDAMPGLDAAVAPTTSNGPVLRSDEWKVYLAEVLRIGQEQLRAADWDLIRGTVLAATNDDGPRPPIANNVRVRLHRARHALAKLTGWRAI
jgi:hypothetical protein